MLPKSAGGAFTLQEVSHFDQKCFVEKGCRHEKGKLLREEPTFTHSISPPPPPTLFFPGGQEESGEVPV